MFSFWKPTPLDRILNPGAADLRRLSLDDLHKFIAGWHPGTAGYIAGMTELQRRQTWSGPVLLSLVMSAVAIAISIIAIALS